MEVYVTHAYHEIQQERRLGSVNSKQLPHKPMYWSPDIKNIYLSFTYISFSWCPSNDF